MLTIVLGLAAALGWAFHDFTIQPATRRAGPFAAMFWAMLTSTVALIAASLMVDGIPTSPDQLSAVGIASMGGVLYIGGVACLMRALSVGNLCIVTPLVALMGGVGGVLAIILGERVGIWALVAIALAVAGATMTSVVRQPAVSLAGEHAEALEIKRAKIVPARGVASIHSSATCPADPVYPAISVPGALSTASGGSSAKRRAGASTLGVASGSGFALAAALLFGFAFVVYGYADGVSAVTAAASGRLAGMVVFVPIALTRVKLTMPGPMYLRTATAGCLDSLAYVAMAAALAIGPVSVASVLSSQFATFAVLLGLVVLHERPTWIQCCGLMLTVSAVVLFSLLA